MTASRIRARLRKARQADNRAFLSAEQKKENPKAAEQFIIFGRRYAGRYYKPLKDFEEFVRRFPAVPKEPSVRSSFGRFVNTARAFARKVARRHEANKRGRKQRPCRVIGGKQSKPASPT